MNTDIPIDKKERDRQRYRQKDRKEVDFSFSHLTNVSTTHNNQLCILHIAPSCYDSDLLMAKISVILEFY